MLVALLPIPPSMLRMLRIFRILRILRLLKNSKGVRDLLMTMVRIQYSTRRSPIGMGVRVCQD